MERATGTEVYGCGSPQSTDITLNIQTTTGGNFSVSLNGKHTVEHLKKVVSKKLKVAKDRICLLHRERQLRDGTLEENGLLDGARVILLPSVETGLLSQRTENSVMQALESLNENQVNDFLTGKSPLNLTMRLGDHMMLIQLQLSTLSSRSLKTSTPNKSSLSSLRNSPPRTCPIRFAKRETKETTSCPSTPVKATQSKEPPAETSDNAKSAEKPATMKKQNFELLKNVFDLYRSMTEEKLADKSDDTDDKNDSLDTTNCTMSDLSDDTSIDEQSPIKSLSNLVSSPLDAATAAAKESIANSVRTSLIDLLSKSKASSEPKPCSSKAVDAPATAGDGDALSDDSDTFAEQSSFLAESTIDEYPMESLFNSAVDKGLFADTDESMMDREISNLATMSHGTDAPAPPAPAPPAPAPSATAAPAATPLPSFQSISEPLKNKRFQYLLHKTSKFKHPIIQNKQKMFMQSLVNKQRRRIISRHNEMSGQASTSRSEPYSRKLILQPGGGRTDDLATPSTSKQTVYPHTQKKQRSPTPEVDSKNLIEASKNLTQKLKKLSKEVLTNKIDFKRAEECVRSKIGPGAVIESMKHHGKGIYSGTFSGTLNPALQDRYGRPKRDISTIIHILNDLLCATPPSVLAPKEPVHSCAVSEERAACAACAACAGGELCAKCDSADATARENSKTRCKLEQLRLVMQQKKQRREARRAARPYAAPPRPDTDAAPAAPPAPQEEIETAA